MTSQPAAPFVHTACRRAMAIAAVAIAVGVSTQAQQPAEMPTPPVSAEAAQSAGPLLVGDLIAVDVFGTPELSTVGRIGTDETITLPVAGKIKMAGLLASEASALIEQRLRGDRVLLYPTVTTRVIERSSRQVTVLGEVNKPGTYLLSARQSLYEALAAAGGVTERQGPVITVTRRDEATLTVNVDQPPAAAHAQLLTPVQSGDIVVVSRAASIYVVGDVARPGEFPLENGAALGALKAVALASGLNRTAAPSKALIVRKHASGTTAIPVDLALVAKNRAEDPGLLASDVLVIPRSGFKSFIDFSLPGAASALAGSVAAALILR